MNSVARFPTLGKYAVAGVSGDPKKFGHMMFWKPNSIHSFHRFLNKIFGGLPA